jgi:hypothetical protein
MKLKLIAVALALASLSAHGADRALAGDSQSSLQTSNDHASATTPERSRLSSSDTAEGTNAPQQEGLWVDSWTQLGNGWKQFGQAGK